MNQNTWISWITTGIGLIGAAAATNGWITSQTATTIAGAAATVVPLVWGWFIHSDVKVAETAGAIPGVKPVQVTAAASPELQRAAADSNIKTVVPAASEPFVSSNITQKRSF
jgi:hypothetical protein